MADIVLDHVTKSYPDGSVAVKDLSLTIADGEFVILVGPSGCGKSTTLNMIAGLEDITSGNCASVATGSTRRPPRSRHRHGVPVLRALPAHDGAPEHRLPLTLAKMNKAEIAAKVDETARILDLSEFLDRKPSQLSGGQRQRVAMGRAIVRNPRRS
jgi:multiple sugar transport system ATP-binding protein